jgi:hypothetical protein
MKSITLLEFRALQQQVATSKLNWISDRRKLAKLRGKLALYLELTEHGAGHVTVQELAQRAVATQPSIAHRPWREHAHLAYGLTHAAVSAGGFALAASEVGSRNPGIFAGSLIFSYFTAQLTRTSLRNWRHHRNVGKLTRNIEGRPRFSIGDIGYKKIRLRLLLPQNMERGYKRKIVSTLLAEVDAKLAPRHKRKTRQPKKPAAKTAANAPFWRVYGKPGPR